MKFVGVEEVKSLALDVLKDIHKFCVENNIRYSIAYGILIGAVRHKGFIPWDDDIDIIMPRKDYERFIVLYSDPHGRYKLHSLHNDDEYNYPFSKVEDSKTVWEENINAKRIGVAVDVFPIDYAGDTVE